MKPEDLREYRRGASTLQEAHFALADLAGATLAAIRLYRRAKESHASEDWAAVHRAQRRLEQRCHMIIQQHTPSLFPQSEEGGRPEEPKGECESGKGGV